MSADSGEGKGRREQVRRYMARRMTVIEIAKIFRVSERTIERDMEAIRLDLGSSVSRKDAITVASDYIARAEVRQRELWAMYGALGLTQDKKPVLMTPAVVNARLGILRELHAEARDEVEVLQKLGIIYEAPKDIRVGFAALEAISRVPEDGLERLARAPIDQFARELARYVGEETAAVLLGLTC